MALTFDERQSQKVEESAGIKDDSAGASEAKAFKDRLVDYDRNSSK